MIQTSGISTSERCITDWGRLSEGVYVQGFIRGHWICDARMHRYSNAGRDLWYICHNVSEAAGVGPMDGNSLGYSYTYVLCRHSSVCTSGRTFTEACRIEGVTQLKLAYPVCPFKGKES